MVTLKTTEMRKHFQPGCVVCEKDVAEIDKMARNGERVIGGATTLSNFKIQMRTATHIVVRAEAHTGAVTKDSTGRTTLDRKAASGQLDITALRVGGSWIVQGL